MLSVTRCIQTQLEATPRRVARPRLAAWPLTQAMSPRATVRAAVRDAAGEIINSYPTHVPVDGPAPDVPWAVNLTNEHGEYTLLALDFDTHNEHSTAGHDAAQICALLTDLNIRHVLCKSGPSDGRHVWIALEETIPAQLAVDLSIAVKRIYPSLDRTPLTNPATGCVRPPGAPHRAGGRSEILAGDEDDLVWGTTAPFQIVDLIDYLNSMTSQHTPDALKQPTGPLPVDDDGHTYISGARRPLPESSHHAAWTPLAEGEDASTRLWTVLIGAAAAHWHYADVLADLATAPGLERIRTKRGPNGSTARIPRPKRGHRSPQAELAHQWRRAVAHVASTPRQIGNDATFEPRVAQIVALVEGQQARAAAMGGRWATGGGPADRRVLDCLHMLALQAVNDTLEADIRRLALHTGLGRETVRVALHRLAADGWIARTAQAHGPCGARWKLDPQNVFHSAPDEGRSQAVTRPRGSAPAHREMLLQDLHTRLTRAAHDCFTHGHAAGIHAGNIYSYLNELTPQPSTTIAHQTGHSPTEIDKTLSRLAGYGLVRGTPRGWLLTAVDRRDQLAQTLEVAGRLATRAHRYRAERELWAWWQAEEAWMRAPGRNHRREHPTAQTLDLGATWARYKRYPRTNRRADHQQARAVIAATYSTAA